MIGILSAVVYASFGDSRKIARDQIRKADLKNLQVAIELYKTQNGVYPDPCPSPTTNWGGNVNSGTYKCSNTGDDFILKLVPDYISALPSDPNQKSLGSNVGYVYAANTARTEYKLLAFRSADSFVSLLR